ncbi:MAG: hypothetical protein GY701_09690 [Sulfitobacter sp.]|nr:hypothetical protein [Sulfitobacter sp.]MCP4087989.1 hypothetical protein [Actinomycetes bacterium]
MDAVAVAFGPLLGEPAWSVTRGHGSFLTFEFGEPALRIDAEPWTRVHSLSATEEITVSTRSAVVHGSWHLWVYCCRWSLTAQQHELANDGSDDTSIDRALGILSGQALTSVDVNIDDGSSLFTFDLGCVLSTRPAPDGIYGAGPVEQWMLYQPSGDVLTVRGDGRYSVESPKEASSGDHWRRLSSGDR